MIHRSLQQTTRPRNQPHFTATNNRPAEPSHKKHTSLQPTTCDCYHLHVAATITTTNHRATTQPQITTNDHRTLQPTFCNCCQPLATATNHKSLQPITRHCNQPIASLQPTTRHCKRPQVISTNHSSLQPTIGYCDGLPSSSPWFLPF